MTNAHPDVAISYAWKEENGGDEARSVETLCERFRQEGFLFLRDKGGVKLGGDLRAFMQRVGTAPILCVFLSDAYLRLPNCMYELLIAWDQSRAKPDEFRERVKIWIMPSAQGIREAKGRIVYTRYWKRERDRLTKLLKPHLGDGASGTELDGLNQVRQFAEKVNEILNFCANSLSPQNFDEFESWLRSILLKPASALVQSRSSIGEPVHNPVLPPPIPSPDPAVPSTPLISPPRLPGPPADLEDRLRKVFGEQYVRLAVVLDRHPALRDALTHRHGLVGMSSTQMTPVLLLRFHLRFLESIGQFSQIYEDESLSRGAVLDLVSEVLYLAMCPDYAASHLKEPTPGEPHELIPRQIHVAEHVRQGIAEMLICWTKSRGRKPVSAKAFSREKTSALAETTPQMTVEVLRRSLLDRFGIDPLKPDALKALEIELQSERLSGRPAFQLIRDKDTDIIDAIRAPGSPLRDLLLLIVKEGSTINPRAEAENDNYDWRFEVNLQKLAQTLGPS